MVETSSGLHDCTVIATFAWGEGDEPYNGCAVLSLVA
jgi:hypothetical protein